MHKVSLANDKSFDAADTVSLLDAAAATGVTLEYSCRNGRCGVCKTRLLAGTTQLIQPEESLTAAEAEAGVILTCCRAATSDVTIEAEDLSFLAGIHPKTLPCRIDSLEPQSAAVLKVVLRLPPTAGFVFLSGQYIDVIAPEGFRRSYSLANAPRIDGRLVLYIAAVDGGRMSQYWFSQAKVNDLLRLEGPFGTFCLREYLPPRLVFLATGTGIAPVKALLEQLGHDGVSVGRELRVYWGLRHEQDICWQPGPEHAGADFIPVLSRADAAWTGRRGYVQQALLQDLPDLAETAVFACGSPDMIAAARELLPAAGLSARLLFSDAFVSTD